MGPFEALRLFRSFNKLQDAWNKLLWRSSMTGWKTWTGLGLYVVSAGLNYLETTGICVGCSAISALIEQIGGGLFGVGVAHKIEKAALLIANGKK